MKASMILSLLGASPAVLACLTEAEMGITKSGLRTRQIGNDDPGDQNEGKIPMGQGDRFNNGNVAPRGIGSQSNASYETFLSYAEVESAMRALAKEFKNVEVFDTPYKTYENRTVRGIKIAGKKSNPKKNKGYEVLLQGGIHPRERGSSDHLIYFAADLLWASREKSDLVYGGVKFTFKEVQAMIDLGLVILPAINPDGYVFDQETNKCWRKNRNPADADPAIFSSVGVDLNRNFDSAWNATKYLAPELLIYPELFEPLSASYPGRGPSSEPETKNVIWTLDNFPDIGWYSDTHSYNRVASYGRCTDAVQTVDKSMNWRNPAYDDVRGIVPDRISDGKYYKEYVDRDDLKVMSYAATRMASAMGEAIYDQSEFRVFEIPIYMYWAVTGCSTDTVYDRHILDKKKKKVFTIGLEFGIRTVGGPCIFYPLVEEYNMDMSTIGAAYGEYLLVAAGLH